MKIYLAALGWISDMPTGNRLRWSYPVEESNDAHKFLGLPQEIIVERAWLNEDIPQDHPDKPGNSSIAGVIPYAWWDNHGTINITGHPWATLELPSPVQAIRFTYNGTAVRLIVYDESTHLVTERILHNGDYFHHEAPSIARLVFLAFSVSLHNVGTVDLFNDRGLKFETIAVIRVIKTTHEPLDVVAPRYTIPPTMTEEAWQEYIHFAQLGQDSSPDAIEADNLSPWTTFQMVMGIRWEHAVLFGHGFVDGPQTQASELDKVYLDHLLQKIPDRPVVYRVREPEKRTKPSNLVVCPPWLATPLNTPLTPEYIDPEVRLTQNPETGHPVFEASLGIRWQQTDIRALGVEIQQTISSSPATGATNSHEQFFSRTRRPEDPPLSGELARVFDVSFHDVTLRTRVRATDGWDRLSAESGWTPVTPLLLKHEPPAPTLASASYNSGTTRLLRQVGTPNFPDWQPDFILQHTTNAKVCVYRKNNSVQPQLASVHVSIPTPVSAGLYRTTISGSPSSLSQFAEGYLIVPPFKTTITNISGNDIFFEMSDEGSGINSLFNAGSATLQQNPLALSLWQKIAEFPVTGLPDELVFADALPPLAGTAEVLSYYTRIHFLGRVGPASNIVQAWRIPATPTVPPPFTVASLGIDFYNRTLIKIHLSTPVFGGKFTVWWANGTPTSADFGQQAVPGEYRAQTAQAGRYLFDVLALPIPQAMSRTITIGVQQVNESGGQSTFTTIPMILPAVAPTA